MRNKKTLLVDQLDKKLKPFIPLKNTNPPEHGWINTIRTSLNMSLEQLGNKLGITRQGAKGIERNEQSGSISISSIKEVADALDMQFVYGFIPKDGSVENLVERKSYELAKKIVLRTNQNMTLEDQAIEAEQLRKSIDELAYELKREVTKTIWD